MKILFAAHQFFPEYQAGTEVLTLGLARALNARGHQAAVFAAKRSVPYTDLSPGETEDYTFDGVPVRRIGRPRESLSRPFRLNYHNPEIADGLREFARKLRPDVVHFMHLQGLSADAIPAVKNLGLPAVYTATDFWTVCPVVDLRRHDGAMCTGPDPGHCPRCLASRQPDSRVTDLVKRMPGPALRAIDALSHVPLPIKPLALSQLRDLSERPNYIRQRVNSLDQIIAPTRLTRDLLVANGIAPELIKISSYGIDTSRIDECVPRNRTAPPGVRFGFIGTLGPHKGCDLLIRAFRALPPELGATLTIYGSDESFKNFGAELRRLAGEDRRISFAGTFAPEKIGNVLSSLDAMVVPSRWYENSPVVIYEAFAARIPVVATDLGGISEVVDHRKNGLLFPLDDLQQLTLSLREIAEEPALIDRLRTGIGWVKTVEESAAEMEKLYTTLMERKRHAR